MTCKLVRPAPQDLFNHIRDMFSATVLGGAPVIQESNEWYVVSNDYAMAEQFYAIADQMWRETDPRTACCENLFNMGMRNGVFPMPAQSAQTYLKLTGVPGTALPSSLEFASDAGTFISVGTVPASIGEDGTAVVQAKAQVPGAAYNSSSITTMSLTTSITDVDSDVEVCGGFICGGADAETCEQFRARYIKRLAYKPRATSAWIQEQLLTYPCATRVCKREGACCTCAGISTGSGYGCSPCASCDDALEFYILFDNSFPCGVAPQNIIDDVNIWVFGEKPGQGLGIVEIGVCGTIYAPKPFYVNVYVDIAGCPTPSQRNQIEADIRDLFTTVCPSVPLYQRTIDMIAANVMGIGVNVSARFEVVDETLGRNVYYQSDCGDLEPECDYMPCLNKIYFTTGGSTSALCT